VKRVTRKGRAQGGGGGRTLPKEGVIIGPIVDPIKVSG